MSNQRFIKDVGILGITQILLSLSSFLLLPIITKTLGAFDYGIWSQINVTISLLAPLVLMGLSMAFVRFYSAKKDKNEIQEGFFSIFLFVAFISFIICLILFIFSSPISLFLFKDSSYTFLFNVSLSLIILGALNTIIQYYFRIFQQIYTFTGISIFRSLGRIFLTIIFLYANYGLFGVIESAIIIESIAFIIGLFLIIKQIGVSFPSFQHLSEFLHYSLPLTPNGLMMWITDSSDRYIIGYFLGTITVGIYSASYGIGYLIFLFVAPIQMILFPQLSKLYDLGDIPAVKLYISYSLKFFLLIALPAVVGLSVLAKTILIILTSSEFNIGYLIIPFVALAAVFSGIVQILSNIIFITKETKFSFYIVAISSILNLLINILLIPIIGYIAAAISTMFSYIVMAVLCYYKTLKHIPIKIDFIFVLKITISSLCMGVIINFLPINNIFYLIILGFFIYFAFVILTKAFSRNEISYIISNLKKIFSMKKIDGDEPFE